MYKFTCMKLVGELSMYTCIHVHVVAMDGYQEYSCTSLVVSLREREGRNPWCTAVTLPISTELTNRSYWEELHMFECVCTMGKWIQKRVFIIIAHSVQVGVCISVCECVGVHVLYMSSLCRDEEQCLFHDKQSAFVGASASTASTEEI